MFVTLEGLEGSGKSTLQRGLAEWLRESGRRVLETREPGAGELGRKIRELLLHGEAMPPESELFLFLADRAHHVATIVRPALERGETVLCDRFADSTVVYQGHARGLDLSMLRELNRFATGGVRPDVTLLLDLEPEQGLGRLQDKDRIDREPKEFHERVRRGFLEEAEREPERFVVLDAARSPAEVLEEAKQRLGKFLGF
jgi:dTMP kinase